MVVTVDHEEPGGQKEKHSLRKQVPVKPSCIGRLPGGSGIALHTSSNIQQFSRMTGATGL